MFTRQTVTIMQTDWKPFMFCSVFRVTELTQATNPMPQSTQNPLMIRLSNELQIGGAISVRSSLKSHAPAPLQFLLAILKTMGSVEITNLKAAPGHEHPEVG